MTDSTSSAIIIGSATRTNPVTGVLEYYNVATGLWLTVLVNSLSGFYAGGNANIGNAVALQVGRTGVLLQYKTVGTSIFTPPVGVTSIDVLVVGAGAGGGARFGGGGAGGAVLENTSYAVTPLTPISLTIGLGGVGAPANSNAGTSGNIKGSTGGNSIFGSITAYGGLGGANGDTGNGGNATNPYQNGGGAAGRFASTGGTAGSGGFAGGSSSGTGAFWGGGGGGAGGSGGAGDGTGFGIGGPGKSSSITGSAVIYGAGGGCGIDGTQNATGVLNNGGSSNVGGSGGTTPTAGAANTGSGGGGSSFNGSTNNIAGASGADGLVAVYYNFIA